jgi:putative ABC transport system permease protein
MVLAVVATYFAASRPGRLITKVPIVQALSGRPAPPRQIHRSALPGIVFLALSFLLLGIAGGTNQGNGSGGMPQLLLGLVLLVPGLILLAPFFLSATARLGRRTPIAARIALRDLARYRARSGSALAAISIGVLVAVIVMLAASARYGNVLDYAGPNLTSSELHLSTAYPPPGQQVGEVERTAKGQLVPVTAPAPKVETATLAQLTAAAETIARGLGAQLITLETPDVEIGGTEGGRNWTGALYVATPQLLSAFGISPSEINPTADILTSRPGLSGISGLALDVSSGSKFSSGPGAAIATAVIQEIPALPSGVHAPNTVITERAMRKFHIAATTTDWLIQGTQPFTAAQIANAERTASTSQLSVESKNDEPTSSSVIGTAALFGALVALAVLAMSVGLVRSETAGDLRTLAATGASSSTRRTITAVTAGALGFLGTLLGVVGGYIAMIGYLRSNSLNGGIAALGNVPLADLGLLLFAMPAFAAGVAWLVAGREPDVMAPQAIA